MKVFLSIQDNQSSWLTRVAQIIASLCFVVLLFKQTIPRKVS